MYKILLTVLFSTITIFANAQIGADTVYLKNGEKISGIIIEQVPGKNIKVKDTKGQVFGINYDDIERITKENIGTENNIRAGVKDFNIELSAGMFTTSATGTSLGLGIEYNLTKNFSVLGFYQICIANDATSHQRGNEYYNDLDLFFSGIKFRYAFNPFKKQLKELKPFLSVGGGYAKSPNASSDFDPLQIDPLREKLEKFYYSSGWFIHAAVGLKIKVSEKITLVTEASLNNLSWKTLYPGTEPAPSSPYKFATTANFLSGINIKF